MNNKNGLFIKVMLVSILIAIIIYFSVTKIIDMKIKKMEEEADAKLHTVVFYTDGGNPIEPKRVRNFASISNISAEKEGYIFTGWLLDGQPIEYSFKELTQDVVLTASYRKKSDTSSSASSNNSSNSSNSNTGTTSNNSNTQTPAANKKTFNVNVREAQKNNWGEEMCALTVMNYQTEDYNSVVGSAKDGQEWIIVNMKFENMSDSTIVLDRSDFEIVDGAEKYAYRAYSKHLDTELDTIEIRAGQTASFSVRFVYFKNNEMSLRFYHPSIVTEVYTDIKLR